jgi:hypothetical protein
MNEEAVVEDQEVEAQPTTNDEGAQENSLDNVLSEIDKEFEQVNQRHESDSETNDVQELRDRLSYLENQSTNTDINKAVQSISESIDKTVPQRAIRGMLNDMAVEDPRLARAFSNRYSDPKGWDRALKAASKEIRKELSDLPDKELNDDRKAVTNAIRGASKSSEDEAPNFTKMSDVEFQEWKAKNG